MSLQVKVKKLNEKAKLPEYATDGSAGMDITATQKTPVMEGSHAYLEYKTGLSFEIPQGHVGLLFPRSSVSKTNLMLANCVGVLDSDFRGEVTFRFKPLGSGKAYEAGDKIGQILIVPFPHIEFQEVAELTDTVRGDGGYGSTGK